MLAQSPVSLRSPVMQHRPSNASKRTRSLPKPIVVTLLEQLNVELTAIKSSRKDVSYAFVVRSRGSDASQWQVEYSFSALRAFQQRLLRDMALGHVCHAECPWLFSLLKGRFPKDCHVLSTSSYVVRKRLAAMSDVFEKFRAAIVNKNNFTACSVLTDKIASAFLLLLTRDLPEDHPFYWRGSIAKDEKSPAHFDSDRSISTYASSNDLEDMAAESPTVPVCSLCAGHNSDENSLSHIHSITKLACGHRFHDECIVNWLNVELVCPTCGSQQ